ncbi:MAG: transcriptional regulator, TetR family, partial [Thermoleophilia bacterium]|nr:transcriptional regulator, TetR family [Thermoleophilia bacterium]
MKHEQALAGRREPLTAERVYRAGVELAARDGFASLTMRKLAKELGVWAMSLYHYVPSRDSLIDGMIDLVFEQIEPPSLEIGWKEAMRARALSTRAALARNRWAVGLMEGRGSPGVASLRLRDAVLGCLRQGGFSV